MRSVRLERKTRAVLAELSGGHCRGFWGRPLRERLAEGEEPRQLLEELASSWCSLAWFRQQLTARVGLSRAEREIFGAALHRVPTGTALRDAATQGQVDQVWRLLGAGVDINAADPRDGAGRTALLAAASGGHEAVVGVLGDRGAELNQADKNGATPLMWAAYNGHTTCVRLLLSLGAGHAPVDRYERTALHCAACEGHGQVVRVLASAGADLDKQSRRGVTAMMEAAQSGHSGTVRLLLSLGADHTRRDMQGKAVDFSCHGLKHSSMPSALAS